MIALLLTTFIYTCYSTSELEIEYEGENDLVVYSYDTVQCGSNVTDSDYSEGNVEDSVGEEKPIEVWVPWSPRFL